MDASLLAVLTESERLLIAETDVAALAALEEDAAIDLEARIRRARGKYVSQYRRSASARVTERGAPGQGQTGEHPRPGEGRGLRAGARPGQPQGRGAGRGVGGGAADGAAGSGQGR